MSDSPGSFQATISDTVSFNGVNCAVFHMAYDAHMVSDTILSAILRIIPVLEGECNDAKDKLTQKLSKLVKSVQTIQMVFLKNAGKNL